MIGTNHTYVFPPVWLIPAVTRAESVVSVFVSPRFLGTVALDRYV
ncbi:hypothetical protein [Halapricum desulfuricans]|nr:hypothetical protein [Halapricum desulfuricans]